MGLLSMGRRKYPEGYDLFAYAEDNNRPSIVYEAKNTVNGKRYIGLTRAGLRRRMGQHIAAAKRGKNYCAAFYRAIRKYGSDAFEFSVLVGCSTYQEAALEEIRLIAELRPEYNLGSGGEGVENVGYRFSDTAREAARKANTGRPGIWLGKKRPDIAEKQRARLTGRPDLMQHMLVKAHTPEAWAKASRTKRERGPSKAFYDAMALRRKKVICLNDRRIFDSPAEAAAALGCKYQSLIRVLNGERDTLYRLSFAYLEDNG